MSKWRAPRVPKPAPWMTTIALGAAMAIAATLALPNVHAGAADCVLFQARLDSSDFPTLELHVCAMIPSTGSAIVVRYDVAVRVALIAPARPR